MRGIVGLQQFEHRGFAISGCLGYGVAWPGSVVSGTISDKYGRWGTEWRSHVLWCPGRLVTNTAAGVRSGVATFCGARDD